MVNDGFGAFRPSRSLDATVPADDPAADCAAASSPSCSRPAA